MTDTTTLPPEVDNRSLHVAPDPEAVNAVENRQEQLKRLLDMYNRQLAMFNSAGWASVVPMLELELQKGVNFLADRRVSHEDTQYVRGQIAALQMLMNLPNTTRANQQHAREELAQLKEALNGQA